MNTNSRLQARARRRGSQPDPVAAIAPGRPTPLERRSSVPARGVVALVSTALGLTLLLTFRTPGVASTAAVTARNVSATTNAAKAATRTTATVAAAGAGIAAAATPAPTTAATTQNSTIDGSVINTRYGAVQVEIVVQNGRLLDISALQLPSGGHSGQISSAVAPMLRSEALTAQSASINTISGATYTSDAYAQSLQSAIAQLPA
jgi:uncharacterized protein with FMN-binding domain